MLQTIKYKTDKDILKQDLLEDLMRQNKFSKYVLEVVNYFGGRNSTHINLGYFQESLYQSLIWKHKFSQLKCRGFSYLVHESVHLNGARLRDDINFRIVLIPDKSLFYPPHIRKGLRNTKNSSYLHYYTENYNSIAFALGKLLYNKCFIFIVQSDIAYRSPSCIREHFRGWRKVLFYTIIQLLNSNYSEIYLPRSCDVVKCCYPGFLKPAIAPNSWNIIYDQTAKEFQLSLTIIEKPINIQVYQEAAPVLINEFYKLDLI